MDLDIAFDADELRSDGVGCSIVPKKGYSEPLDLQHLGRYTLGDRDLEQEILELFIEQVPKTLEALKTASSGKDWQMAAHTLKGSGRAVGAWRVAELAEHAERIGDINDCSARRTALAGLEQAAAEARAFIAGLDQA